VYASNGQRVLAILRGSQARIIVKSDAISPWLKHSIVAIEDKRFYEHRGIDLRGMGRALWTDISSHGTVQGGSTITQQFVKNAFLTSQKTIGRKLFEAALAWQLEQRWSKDRILTAYLNTVYFGNGAYGVEQASRIYFHHSAAQMRPSEAALLAGIPEDPSLWDPVAHPKTAKARRNFVLRQLYRQGYITLSQYGDGKDDPMPDPAKVNLPSTQGQAAPYKFLMRSGIGTDAGARAYYKSIIPGLDEATLLVNGAPYTEARWEQETFKSLPTTGAYYQNTLDLGFWRDMVCTKTIGKGDISYRLETIDLRADAIYLAGNTQKIHSETPTAVQESPAVASQPASIEKPQR